MVIAPMSSELSKWSVLVRSIIATGQVFGRHDQLGDKVLEYGSPTEYLVAWHADPPYDYVANWMLRSTTGTPQSDTPG